MTTALNCNAPMSVSGNQTLGGPFTKDQARALLAQHEGSGLVPSPDFAAYLQTQLGQRISVLTVTFYWRGELVAADAGSLRLRGAELILETGDFAKFAAGGPALESQPYPPDVEVAINLGAVVGVAPANGSKA